MISVACFSKAFATINYAENFQSYLENENFKTLYNEPLYKEELLEFYRNRNFKPVWYDANNKDLNDISDIREKIYKQAYLNGLEPSDYKFNKILASKNSKNNDEWIFEREWMLTNSVMHYINDIRSGRIQPNRYDPLIFLPPQKRQLANNTAELIKTWNKGKFLESLIPPQKEYRQLREKLTIYRDIQKKRRMA